MAICFCAIPAFGIAQDQIPLSDTAIRASPADSLSALMHIPDSALVLTDSFPVEQISDPALEIFGDESYIVKRPLPEFALRINFSGDIYYQLLTICLLVVYLHLIFSKRPEAAIMLRIMFARQKEGRSPDDYQSVLSRFTNSMMSTGLLSLGIYAAKIMEIWCTAGSVPLPPIGTHPALIVIGAAVIIGLVSVAQYLFLKFAGSLTFENTFIKKLLWMKAIFLAVFFILSTPLVLLAAVAPVQWAIWPVYIVAILVSILFIGYGWKSAKLFVSQKVSILFWFLYLCAVELMPFGIVILAAYRSVAG